MTEAWEDYKSRVRFFNREGEPLTVQEWGELFGIYEYKMVRRSHIGDYLVSTVWTGLPALTFREGPPLIFETMVFEGEVSGNEWDEQKWATEAEAIDGHELLCAEVREHLAKIHKQS